jgi:hypothetical protein
MKKLRAALRDKFGPRRYRISQRGEVVVYGAMPNTNAVGWYFYGYIEDMPHKFDLED